MGGRDGYSTFIDLGAWLSVVAGTCGAIVAIYGVEILLFGRATRGDRRAFRRLADAGRYYLLMGLALVVLVSAGLLDDHGQSLPTLSMIIVAVALGGLAIRYRPRKDVRR